MTARKYSASMDDTLLADIRAAADEEGITLSSWLADAATHRLRLGALRRMVEEWETEHGAIGAAELDTLEYKLAVARRNAADRAAHAGRTGAS